jgi:hypothetical protein
VREVLSDYLRSKAAWRREQKKEFPNDTRNEKSAAALEGLADYVDSGEASETALERLKPHQHDAETLGGERTWRIVSRYGYLNIIVEDHHRAFLDELGAVTQLDAYNHAVEHDGEDPTGTLTESELQAAKDGVTLPRRYFELRLQMDDEEREEALRGHLEGAPAEEE